MKIGEIINTIDERNSSLEDLPLLGLSMEKKFINSVANTIGTDMSKYKILCKNQFATNFIHVGRDGKVPIALYQGEKALVSSAYDTFEVKDSNKILPEYLFLWFKRSEFDREATFYASAGIRGGFDWEDFINMEITVPSIEEQRRIVSEYHTVERRIKNNEAMIQKLEETAQALYHHTFVEGIDENNLPEGWRKGCLGDVVEKTFGGDWGKDCEEGNYTSQVLCLRGTDIPFAQKCQIGTTPIRYIPPKNLSSRALSIGNIVIEISGGTEKQSTGRCVLITDEIINSFGLPIICSNFCRFLTPRKKLEYFLFAALKNEYIKRTYFKYENSSNNIHNLDLECFLNDEELIIPNNITLEAFNNRYATLIKLIHYLGQENSHLSTLLSLLTSKLS